MNPIDLSSIQKEIASNPAVLVYFFSNRCAPCVSLRPKIKEMIDSEFPKIKLLLVDSELFPLITANFGVFANPGILVFLEGQEFHRWSKYVSVTQIAETLKRPYNLLFD